MRDAHRHCNRTARSLCPFGQDDKWTSVILSETKDLAYRGMIISISDRQIWRDSAHRYSKLIINLIYS